jgi:hypothetical protein
LSKKKKLKLHMFKMIWDTKGCTESHKDLSEAVRKDTGTMERYWNITERVSAAHIIKVTLNNREAVFSVRRLI